MPSKNVTILAICQALSSSAGSLVVFVGGILGADLAPTPELSTLPITAMVIGTALAAVPASLFMRRYGRQSGFLAAALLAALAAGGAVGAILAHHFLLLCASILLIGVNLAFVQQYRFAAVESQPTNPGRAVSYVLMGGIVAGFLGPEIGRRSKDWLGPAEYAGSFAAIAGLYLLVALLLSFLTIPRMQTEAKAGLERPLGRIVAQPAYLVAVLAGMVAFGVMSFVMTATPISMHRMDGHSLAATGLVIQSHVLAMYLPSLFSGSLVGHLGIKKVMALGTLAMMGCAGLTLAGHGLPNYWLALVLLGLGWNFLFVSGTVLLTQSHTPAERFRAQAVNDFMIFAIQAIVSLSAGAVLFRTGWNTLVAITLPVLLGMAAAIYLVKIPAAAPGGEGQLSPPKVGEEKVFSYRR